MPASRRSIRQNCRSGLAGGAVVALVVGAVSLIGASPAQADPTSYPVVATIPLGTVGDGMVVDHEHAAVYVVRPEDDQLAVVDMATNTVTASIPVGDEPFRVAIDPGMDRAYVSNFLGNSVSVIDTNTNTVVDTLYGFNNPRDLAVDPTTHLLYVANYYGNQHLTVVHPVTYTIWHTGLLESRPWAVDVDPTTHRAYATTLFGGSFSTIENTAGGWAETDRIYLHGGPTQILVDPATSQAYVAHGGQMTIVDISETQAAITGTVPAGATPSDAALDPGTGWLYVSNLHDGTVSVVDQASNTNIATVAVGGLPNALGLDPVTHRVYVLDANGTMSVIAPFAEQAITFTSTVPTTSVVGDTYTVTAVGGGSGEPVVFSTSSTTCTVSAEGAVVLTRGGTCVIRADQAGNDHYNPAPIATQTLEVGLHPTTTTASLPATGTVFGEPLVPSASVTGTSEGSVQFTVDGDPVGDPVAIDEEGEATGPEVASGLAVGSHQVGATFTPTDGDTYAVSVSTPLTLAVSKAATTTAIAVDPSKITATVTPTAPGAGTPAGTVRFYVAGLEVGSAELGDDGTAEVGHQVPSGSDQAVSAVYEGDAGFTGSSASTARRDPVITATVSSDRARRNGWYSSPVTVTFHCEATSAELTEACPEAVTLTRSGAGRSVTRTVLAEDGGAATVVVSGINIDRIRPVVRVTGVRSGATYFASRPAGACRATDSLSGIARCTLTRTNRGRQVLYVATATDEAGNRSVARLVARTTLVAVSGASMKDGQYVVHRGRTYTVLVASAKRPRYIYAAPAPHRPAGNGPLFRKVGENRWALGVTFTRSMRHHALWNIGTRVGDRTTVTTVRVVK